MHIRMCASRCAAASYIVKHGARAQFTASWSWGGFGLLRGACLAAGVSVGGVSHASCILPEGRAPIQRRTTVPLHYTRETV